MVTAQQLRVLESLRDFTDRELEMLLGAATPRRYAEGATLMVEGAPGASCFVVVAGEVEVLRSERAIARQGAGAIVGHMALVDRAPRSATVRAATRVVALEFTRDVFEGLLEACSPLAIRFQEQVARAGIRQLRRSTERLREVLATSKGAAPTREERETLEEIQAAASEWSVPVTRTSR